MSTTLRDLRSRSLDELEELFAHADPVAMPSGVYRGHFLAWLDHPDARRWRWRWPERVCFEWAHFGIDFDRHLWFFFHPSLAAGHFAPRIESSRWRDTEAVALHYDSSRLPAGVKGLLYDEVKPFADGWVLGLGGLDVGEARGDHFFFALQPDAR